jgi:hypothetical protein
MSNIKQIDQQDPTLGEEVAFLQSCLHDQRHISAQYRASVEAAVMALESGDGGLEAKNRAALLILRAMLTGEAFASESAA